MHPRVNPWRGTVPGMLALALSLTILAAPPRGLPAAHTVELVTQVEKRVVKWLTGAGDRQALLANAKELEALSRSRGVKPDEVKATVAAAVKEQADLPELKQFSATRVLVEYAGKATTLSFFDESGHRCEVPLFSVGTEVAPRYVLISGPRTDARAIEDVAGEGKAASSMMVYAEKKDGAWSTGSMPRPPPPDCKTVLEKALKAIFTAEKAYFAEHDAYSNSLTKVGVDAKTLGITSAKVSVAGAAPQQTFTIQVGLGAGLMRMNDKGEISVVDACSP